MTPLRFFALATLVLVSLLSVPVFAQDDPDFSGAAAVEGEGLSFVGVVPENQPLQTVSQDEIEKAHAQDLPGLLEKTLNLTVNQNGGYGNQSQASLRGLGSGRVAILIDGVPVNSDQTGGFDLSRINVASIEKIEVVSGGSDTQYNVNGAIGGVINLVTFPHSARGLKFGVGLSNLAYYPGKAGSSYFDTQSGGFNLSLGGDEVSWSLDLNADKAANNFQYSGTNGPALWAGNGIVDAGASSNLSVSLPGNMRLRVSENGLYASKNIPGPLGSNSPGRETDLSARTTVQWTAATVGGESLSTELSLSHRLESTDWTDPATHSLHNLNTFGVIHRWTWAPIPAVSVRWGADLDYSHLDSTSVGALDDASGGISLTPKFSVGAFDAIPSAKAVFAKDLSQPVLVPKLGLVYRLNEAFTVKNNYFRAFKLPSINDRYWPSDGTAVGNPALRPEDGVGSDLSLEGSLPKILSFQTTVHGTWLRDAILWQPVGSLWSPRNVGQAFYSGADQTVRSEFHDVVKLTARYSFLMTYMLSDGLTFADDKRMPYAPVHHLGVGVDFDWKKGSFSLDEHYESERYISTLNVTQLAPYFTVDALYRQDLDDGLSCFVTVKNAFNQTYFSVDGYPMPGGSVTAGVRYQWGGK